MTGVCFFFMIVVQLLSFTDFNKKICYVSYNHEYYLEGKNLFKNSICKKSSKIVFARNILKQKLSENIVKVYFNTDLNIQFKVYELKDNFQMLVFKTNELTKKRHWFDYNDYEINIELLIEKLGVSDFSGELGIEHYYSNNKRSFITITKNEDYFFTCEYNYFIEYFSNWKTPFEAMLPHWLSNRDGLNCRFDSIEVARKYAMNEIDRINNSKSNICNSIHYFILEKERIGTAFHEFQMGNKTGVYWDKASILLSDDIMQDSSISSLFERIIPNYDYYGPSIVTKETWELLKEAAVKESEIIRDIIREMTPWAERSIELYKCFTIIGI